MSSYYNVVVMNDQIADRSGRKVHLQRLPMVAVVPGDVDAAFGSGEKQALALGIFADRVDGFVGQSGYDLLPTLAAIVCAIDIRMEVVEAEAVHGSIDGCGVEVRGVELGELAPRSEFRRRNVLPVLAAIASYLDHAIVGSGPDQVGIFRRRSQRIDHAAMLALGGIGLDKWTESCGNARIFASEVRADDLPTVAAVARGKKHVRSQIQHVRISGRENQRRSAIEAVLSGAQNHRRNVTRLACIAVEHRNLTAVDQVGMQRIGRNVAVFFHA